jgi:hypothetical protein
VRCHKVAILYTYVFLRYRYCLIVVLFFVFKLCSHDIYVSSIIEYVLRVLYSRFGHVRCLRRLRIFTVVFRCVFVVSRAFRGRGCVSFHLCLLSMRKFIMY